MESVLSGSGSQPVFAIDLECELVLAKKRVDAVSSDDERKTKAGWLMDVLFEELQSVSGEQQPLAPVEIHDGALSVVISPAGWPVMHVSHAAPGSGSQAVEALGILAELARGESEPLIDALMDMTLEHRTALVERIIEIGEASGAASDAAAALRFIDEGLSLDGDAAALSIRIHEVLLEAFDT